ncbi:MAG: aminotransferase class I/II-fold pyridoxal phosphate-dependent enzyme [Desulfobacteraceae bacterium]|nr:aminotransferase class I/II-fold pyridoxal phosphate-dependent enzyme [Desulfobacteraceae bacterium]
MNPIAEQLNEVISNESPHLMEMLSDVGKNLFFPRGILSQSAEAKEKATRLNATIGIAKQEGGAMVLPSVMSCVAGLAPEESVTYAPSFGIAGLRRQWQESLFEKNPTLEGKNISLPVVTSGVTHAISIFADIWTDPGDVLVLPDMMWGNYNMIFNVRKKVRISHYPIFTADGGYNVEAMADCVKKEAENNQKVIVLLNFPHNPTGYTVTESEADRIVSSLVSVAEAGTNVIVACDDAYFGLFYEDGVLTESVFARLCQSHPRLLAVKLDGATKENYVWGLRVGFLTYGAFVKGDAAAVYDALERKTAGCVRGNISNSSHLSQSIVLRAMRDENYRTERQSRFELLRSRAETVKKVLQDPKYASAWDVYPFNSGYFMCIRLKSVNAETLRVHLLDNYGVGLIALGEHDLRVAFSCLEQSEIKTLFDIVYQGVQDLS